MSELRKFEFKGNTVHTLTHADRPAWIAREIGAALGYANEGKRLVNKITGDWKEDFLAGHDFDLVVGAELAGLKAQVASVAPSARGLVVLYESGLHMTLVKTQAPAGRELRRFLVEQVMPQLARTGAYAPAEGAGVLNPEQLRELRLAARVDLDDRKFRSAELHQTASALLAIGRIDARTWVKCRVAACEIALGRALPRLLPPDDRGWPTAQELAHEHGWTLPHLMGAAASLELLDRPDLAVPVPIRGPEGWTLTFRFSPTAALQIEAWLEDDSRRSEPSRLEPAAA